MLNNKNLIFLLDSMGIKIRIFPYEEDENGQYLFINFIKIN